MDSAALIRRLMLRDSRLHLSHVSHFLARRQSRRRPSPGRPALAECLEERRLLSATLTTVASFNGANGMFPSGLISDATGNLYGVTQEGGSVNTGTAYEIAAGTSTITTLASFQGQTNVNTLPATPMGRLFRDASGNLFGATSAGGADSAGTVFEIAPGSGAVTALASFSDYIINPMAVTGDSPQFGVIGDAAGNLYGTALVGGFITGVGVGAGTVFELPAGANKIAPLATFTGMSDGGGPNGLLRDAAGNLFGTAGTRGPQDDGTVFEVAAGSNAITTLASFNGANGQLPTGTLVADASGNLFGTTFYGGANNLGTLFEVQAGSNAITTLASFNGANGMSPNRAGLIFDAAGDLFGTTASGGDLTLAGGNGDGTLFELPAGSKTLTTLVTFDGSNGAHPSDSLVFDSAGNLYGTTEAGGASGDGTIFKLALGVVTPTPTPTPAPTATISIDDPIALYNPPDSAQPYQQKLTAGITNTGTADATFDLSVKQLGSGNVTLSDSSLTVPAGQSVPVTITPAAVSSAGNDVEIDVSSGGALIASKLMTVVSVTIPQDIYSSDTPNEMLDPGLAQGVGPLESLTGTGFFRIAPGAANPTTENVMITPDLKPIGQSVTLLVTGQGGPDGSVLVNGNKTKDVASTGDIQLTGTTQTSPGAGGQLQLTVDVAGQNTIQSDGFSVAAIPNMVTISKAANATGTYNGLTLDKGVATQAYGFVTLVQFASDGGNPLDLTPVTVKKQAQVLRSQGAFGPTGVLNTLSNRYGPAGNSYVNPDTTAISPLVTGSNGGGEIDAMDYTFNDPRTGAMNIPVPNSGFKITRLLGSSASLGGFFTAETPASVSPNGFTSSLGSGDIFEAQSAAFSFNPDAVRPAPGPAPATGASGPIRALNPAAAGPAAQLAITSQPPASLPAGAAFGLVVQAEDSAGAVASGFNGSVTLRLNKYSGDPTATLGGTITVAAVNGVATFTGLTLTKSGKFSITATASGLTEQTSGLVTVTPRPATSLIVGGPTGNVLTSSPFTVRAAAVDASGNIDTSFNGTVTISLTTNPAGAALGGTVSANAVNGVATFSGLTLNKPGSGYVLTASGGGFTAASSPFDVNDDQLMITAQPPASAATGQAFGVTVQAQNAAGRLDTSYNGDITLALDPGTTAPGVSLQGPVTLQAVNGVATFSGLTMADPGSYTLVAGGAGAAPAHSQTFQVMPTATRLAVAVQPPVAVSAGAGFEVDVAAEDANGNVDTSFNGNVTLTLASNPAGGSLGGTVTAAAVNGVATLTGLTLNNPGNGYTLTASASGLSSTTTAAINVLPAGKATQLVFTTQPVSPIEAGFSTGVVVKAEDSFGTVDQSFAGPVTLTDPGGRLAGTLTVNAVAGVATFLNVMPEGAGTDQTLIASSTGLVSGPSVVITVTAANATQAVLSGPSQNVLPGSPFSFDVFAVDRFGNVDPTYTGTVTLSLKDNPSGATLGGTLTASAAAGQATFTGLTLNQAGTGFTLQATAPGLTAGTSPPFDVTTDQLVLTVPPGAAVPLLASPTITVSAENSSGAVDTSFNGPVTVSRVEEGTGTATLGGSLTVNAVAGVATFSDLTLDQTGAYALRFTSPGVGAAQSGVFTVTPRAATTITLAASPATVPFDNPVTLTAKVTSSAGGTTGSGVVTFFSQGAVVDTAPVRADGTAVLVANAGTSGVRSITASFNGNGNFLPSTPSSPASVTVGPQSSARPNLGRFVFPATALAGRPIKTSLPVVVTNGGASLKGRFTVKLFMDLGTKLSPDPVQLGSATRTLSLATGESVTLPFHVRSLPATVPTGDYHFLAEVIDPTGATDVESTSGTIAVQAAVVTLGATAGAVKPGTIRLNHAGTATVVVTDTGNVDAAGPITIVLSPSSDGATPVPGITLATLHRIVRLRVNRPTAFPLHFKVTTALPAGTYRPYFSVSLDGAATTAVGNSFSAGL